MDAFSFLAVLFSLLIFSSAFNVDTRFAVIKEIDNPEALFGYSVDQHSSEDANPVFDQILVGAPLHTTDQLSPFQNTGALYHCPVDVKSGQANTRDCEEFIYPDTQGVLLDVSGSSLSENKTDMWLGVTVRSAGAGKLIAACGHRYKVQESGRSGNVYGLGMCYFYNSDYTPDDTNLYKSPCSGEALVSQKSNEVSGAFGLCAAGMGMDAVDRNIVYGFPGAVTWRGTAAWELGRNWPDFPLYYRLDPNIPGQDYTDLCSYQGSSMLLATNLLNDKKRVAVVGAPREFDIGSVMIYNLTETPTEMAGNPKLVGPQFGSAFGTSLAIIDIKNDQHPSLVVGAPFYRPEGSYRKSPIQGAICVYYNNGFGILRKHVLITPGDCNLSPPSLCNKAHQFGYSISSLGDINGDGYHDLAVGAPQYGDGAVFIYGGTKDGMLTSQPTQVIMASDVNNPFSARPLSGFGISVSGGQDMDGQGYTDLLVGAHSSSHVVILRSRPIVNIDGRINILTSSVDPEKTKCDSNPTVSRPCIDFEVCFTAKFEKSSVSVGDVSLDYTVTVDSGYEVAAARRVVFNTSKTDISNSVKSSQIDLSLDSSEKCINETVYVTDLGDILKPIQMDLKYSLVETSQQFEDINKYLILNSSAPATPSVVVDYKKDCKTLSCQTDMGIWTWFSNPQVIKDPVTDEKNEFVFNSDEVDQLLLTFRIVVDSAQDPAYVAQVNISLPPELKRVGNITFSDAATSCSDSESTPGLSTCSFGKKLDRGDELNVTFRLDPSGLGPTYSQINLTASTSSDDVFKSNNVASLRVKVVVVTDLELLGTATIGDRATYGGIERGVAGISSDDQIGPLVQHTYTMINNGSGKVSKVNVHIQWPYATTSGRYLLYMINDPSFKFEKTENGLGQCGPKDGGDKHINEEGYKIVDPDSLTDVGSSRLRVLRKRRDAPKRASAVRTLTDPDGASYDIAVLNCLDGTAQCFNIECEFVNFGPGDVVRITLNSRLWNTTLQQEYGTSVSYINVMSSGALSIDPAAKVSQRTTNDKANITTEVEPNIETAEVAEIPFWVYIIAASCGLLILILIIVICWKCGFFKRHRPMTYEVKVEKQGSSQYKQVPQNDSAEINS